jgi:hypothetical protein
MADSKELGKALEGVLMDFLNEVKSTNMGDLQEYARKIAADAIEVASFGHSRVPQELLAHMLMLAEIARIRMTTKVKAQLVAALQTAVGILVKVL